MLWGGGGKRGVIGPSPETVALHVRLIERLTYTLDRVHGFAILGLTRTIALNSQSLLWVSSRLLGV